MEYTQNYQLPLWDKEDSVLRTDFNGNNQKIDAALGELTGAVKIAVGSYVGDDAADRYIALEQTPKAVILFTRYILPSGSNLSYVVFITSTFAASISSSVNLSASAALEGNGFRISSNVLNITGETNHYIVFY